MPAAAGASAAPPSGKESAAAVQVVGDKVIGDTPAAPPANDKEGEEHEDELELELEDDDEDEDLVVYTAQEAAGALTTIYAFVKPYLGNYKKLLACVSLGIVIETLITEDAPSPRNPLGLKGGGEAGINAVGAVIASAIDDAIGIPGAVTELPVTPQRLRAILRKAGK